MPNTGPIQPFALIAQYKKTKGERPKVEHLEGDAKRRALDARHAWDNGLFARSPLIRDSVANDVCMLDNDGNYVPKRRR